MGIFFLNLNVYHFAEGYTYPSKSVIFFLYSNQAELYMFRLISPTALRFSRAATFFCSASLSLWDFITPILMSTCSVRKRNSTRLFVCNLNRHTVSSVAPHLVM